MIIHNNNILSENRKMGHSTPTEFKSHEYFRLNIIISFYLSEIELKDNKVLFSRVFVDK